MTDLRLVLLGIGLFIIAVIYLWGTFNQKLQDRSHSRKLTNFRRNSPECIKITPTTKPPREEDEENAVTLAELDNFLANSKEPEINTSDFVMSPKTAAEDGKDDGKDINLSKSIPDILPDSNIWEQQSQKATEDKSTHPVTDVQIITFLIKAPPGREFSGVSILKAAKAVGLKFGELNIFHHYGVEGLMADQAIFSLASMYEPGYFDLEKIETYNTKGLALFMQLPVTIDSIAAFDLMQETAMKLADVVQGEIWSSEHKPIDEKTLRAMRDVAVELS